MRRRLLCAGAMAALLLLLAASPAFAVVQWSVTSVHGPQNLPPGGTGQYMIQAFNLGDSETTDFYTIEDTLPAGVTATAVYGTGWDCPGLPIAGPATVTCSHDGTDPIVRPPGTVSGTDARFRGAARTLTLEVSVDPGATGTEDNQVTVSGGDPGAVPASATDPTTFSSTPAGFGFVPSTFLADAFDGPSPTASPVRQAGSHPFEMRVWFDSKLKLSNDPDAEQPNYTEVDDDIKTLETRLPAGLLGNPEALPKCPALLLNDAGPNGTGACPANTQVGTIDLILQDGESLESIDSGIDVPVFNMEPPPGTVAAFAVSIISNPVWIIVTLDPTDHYSVIATISDQIEVLKVRSAQLSLWGVPADPAHDVLRLDGRSNDAELAMNKPFTGAPIKPLLTLPMQCDAAGSMQVRADSWDHPGVFTPFMAGTAATMTGCDDPRFRFKPTISVQPESRKPGVPTGLDVELSVPQKDDTVTNATQLYADSGDDRALPTPPMRDATVTLPAGMAISPSSANGLASCTPAQIGIGTNDEPSCPDAAKLGSMTIDTPVLPDPLSGTIYLAAQDDNPFHSMLAIYLVAKGPGVIVKLPGHVTPDPVTGQLKATFSDNPQLPFTKLTVHFDGGPFAALVNPLTCGVKQSTADMTSWNSSLPAVHASDSFTISGDGKGGPCTPRGFDPGFVAGTSNPVAGKDTPIVTRFSRSDADEEISTVDVTLPEGVLGRIKNVDLCSDLAANAGTCADASRIGTVTVGAGPGSNPFFITDGKAFITKPYKGAPFGLSIVVHAKAGPLDLGNVVVRGQVLIDKTTAKLRVVTDPLPTILAGIPLQLRIAQVTVDRPHFTFNPTNCSELHSSAHLVSTGGKTSDKTSRFKVTNCAALPFKPRISFELGGKGHTHRGNSTPLTTVLRMTKGQANLSGVNVVLPLSLNALLPVVTNACTFVEFQAGKCEKARAGTAVAVTPLLKHSLRGGAYFVKDPTRPKGSLPNLMVALRGQVDVDLTGKIKIPSSGQLGTDFDTVPDVPITKFTLSLVSGRHGPIGVVENLCKVRGSHGKVDVTFHAQNGKVVHVLQPLVVNGCAKKKASKATRKSR